MTPPDNPEANGSNGAAAGPATPPWQRVAKDESNGGSTPAPAVPVAAEAGNEATIAQKWPVAGEGPAPATPAPAAPAAPSIEETQPAAQYDRGPATGEQPLVSGTAAARLFGGGGAESTPPPAREGGKSRPTPSALRRPGRGPRRASLQIKRFDPWSVLKLSLVLGVALFFVWLVAVGVLYTVLDGMGVWEKLNGTYSSLVQGEGTATASEPLISAGRVFGVAAIVGAINIVLLSALATVSAFIYNVSADLAGGLEVTLSERE